MIAFEKFLSENGFTCFYYEYKNGKQTFSEGYRVPSSMTNIYNE